jgi:hypothetical protein
MREGLYLYLERQSDPSWIKVECQAQVKVMISRKGGRNSRVLAWMDEVEMSWRGWDTPKR